MAAVGFALVSAPITHAKTMSDMSPKEQALSYSYVRMMQTCIASGSYPDGTWANNRISDENAKSYKFFGSSAIGAYHSGLLTGEGTATIKGPLVINKGAIDCSDSTWVKNALSLWGYSNPLDFLCGVDGGKEGIGAARTDGQDCRQNTNPFQPFDIGNFTRVISDGVYGGGDILQLGPEAQYVLNLTSFNSLCASTPAQPGIDPNNEWLHTGVQVVQADGTIKDVDYLSSTKKRTDTVQYDGDSSVTCEELKNRVNASAGDYAFWAENHKEEAAAQGQVGQNTSGTPSGDEPSSCVISGVGWIVCPVVTFVADLTDVAFGFLADNFLSVDIGIIDPDSKTHEAWSQFLGLGNAVFIVAFLVVIYSQVSGLGLSNYGVKKMLPRIIVMAILINLSFYICQLAVDLSNILGYNLKSFLAGMISAPAADGSGFSTSQGFWSGVAITVLAGAGVAGGVAAAGGITLALVALILILFSALIAVMMIFLILTIRQVVIILLIVLAPVAFAAAILPNTESLFKKWQKMFTSMLLLFPIVGLIFGASTLASNILADTYSESDNLFGQIVAAGILVLPLFVVPTVLKKSLDILGGGIGAKLSGFGSKLGGGLRKRADESGLSKHLQNQSQRRNTLAGLGVKQGSNKNPFNWGRNARAFATRRTLLSGGKVGNALNKVTDGYGGELQLAAERQAEKDIQEQMSMFGGDDQLARALAESGGNTGHAAYRALSTIQKQQFDKIAQSGYATNPNAHLATARYLSENGKGSARNVTDALAHAQTAGASATTIQSAREAAKTAYRKSGRGDAIAEMDGVAARFGWTNVAASAVHRDGVATPQQLDGYREYLEQGAIDPATGIGRSGQDATVEALRAYDKMDARTQQRVEQEIVAAASTHTRQSFGSIQEARKYFGIS